MSYPQQQPPVMHGYAPAPPNNDWPPAAAKKRGLPLWIVGLGILLAAITIGVVTIMDNATVTPEERPGEARQKCLDDLAPAKLSAMADPKTADYTRVAVSTSGDIYTVKGLVSADRVSNDRFDGVPNRYRFECSMTWSGDGWTSSYASVLPL